MNMIDYVYNDRNNFIKLMLDKITKIEHFGKIFNLFKNNISGNAEVIENYLIIQPDLLRLLLENDRITILMTKFRELMHTYNINNCKNFIYDSCLLIYLIDSYKKNSVNFLDDVILKYINANNIKTKIISILLSNPYISNNLISFLIHYYFQNMIIINNDIEELIIKKLNNNQNKQYNHHIQIIVQIFENLNRLNINQEDLFNEDENIEFFILLKKIQHLINNQKFDLSICKDKYTILKDKIINLKDKIINDLKNGNIKYDLIHSWLTDNEKKKLLIERLNILSFSNTKEVDDCLKSLENRMSFIIKTKEEIITNLNNSFNFISEFATQNIGNTLNNLKDIIIKNINLELINK
jgi:hypothetical protein